MSQNIIRNFTINLLREFEKRETRADGFYSVTNRLDKIRFLPSKLNSEFHFTRRIKITRPTRVENLFVY